MERTLAATSDYPGYVTVHVGEDGVSVTVRGKSTPDGGQEFTMSVVTFAGWLRELNGEYAQIHREGMKALLNG